MNKKNLLLLVGALLINPFSVNADTFYKNSRFLRSNDDSCLDVTKYGGPEVKTFNSQAQAIDESINNLKKKCLQYGWTGRWYTILENTPEFQIWTYGKLDIIGQDRVMYPTFLPPIIDITKTRCDINGKNCYDVSHIVVPTFSAFTISSPDAPQNLIVVSENSQASLSWAAPINNGGDAITNYEIYRGTASGGETLLTETANVLTYTDTTVSNGTKYFYKIAAKNTKGIGTQSSEADATPFAIAPEIPQNFSANSENAQVSLNWNSPTKDGGSPITGYLIYKSEVSGQFNSSPIEIGNVLNYVDTAVINGATYYYKIAAKNNVGASSQSGEINASPSPIEYKAIKFDKVVYRRYCPQAIGIPCTNPEAKYICSPFVSKYVAPDGSVYLTPTDSLRSSEDINWQGSYKTQTEATTKTMESLLNCLNSNGYIKASIDSFPIWKNGTMYNSPNVLGGRGSSCWGAKPSCAESGSTFTKQNANSCCTLSGNCVDHYGICFPYHIGYMGYNYCANCGLDSLWVYKSLDEIKFSLPSGASYANYGYFSGSMRQVDYNSEWGNPTIHLKTIICGTMQASLSGCSRIEDTVPTSLVYTTKSKPSNPRNVKIIPINRGFSLSWDPPLNLGGENLEYIITRSGVGSTTEIQRTTTSFDDNKFKETPQQKLSYTIRAKNSLGSSDGIIVTTDGLNYQNKIENISIYGAGFLPPPVKIEVALINPGANDLINCSGFKFASSTEITNGVCDISAVTTGLFDVKVVMKDANNNILTQSTLKNGFRITYPEPGPVTINPLNFDLTSGKLTINSVSGDLATGYNVYVSVNGIKHYCFSISNYDWSTLKFEGGSCYIDPTWFIAAEGNMDKFSIVIAGDENSYEESVGGTAFTCTDSIWSPPDSTVCQGSTLTQISNCGVRKYNVSGTLTPIWSPAITSNTCGTLLQSTTNCSPVKNQSVLGPKICNTTKQEQCINNNCVCVPNISSICVTANKSKRECGNMTDPVCGGMISCGTCDEGYTCSSSGECQKN